MFNNENAFVGSLDNSVTTYSDNEGKQIFAKDMIFREIPELQSFK